MTYKYSEKHHENMTLNHPQPIECNQKQKGDKNLHLNTFLF